MLMEGQEDALRERDEMEQALNDLYFEQAEEEYRKKAEALRIHVGFRIRFPLELCVRGTKLIYKSLLEDDEPFVS